MRYLLALGALLVAFQASAQSEPTKVFVTPKNATSLSQSLTHEVRELIRASNGLTNTDANDQALVQVSVATLESPPGDKIVFSAVLTIGGSVKASGMYLNNFFGVCRTSDLKGCAKNIVVGIDGLATNLRSEIQAAREGT